MQQMVLSALPKISEGESAVYGQCRNSNLGAWSRTNPHVAALKCTNKEINGKRHACNKERTQKRCDPLPWRYILSPAPVTVSPCELLHHFINSPGMWPSMADTGTLWRIWFGRRKWGGERKEYAMSCNTIAKRKSGVRGHMMKDYISLRILIDLLGALNEYFDIRAFEGNSFTNSSASVWNLRSQLHYIYFKGLMSEPLTFNNCVLLRA